MKREILSEVNRFREIMGLNLLSEGPIPKALIDDLAKAFGRTEDQLFSSLEKKEVSALNRVFDDVADATGKSADDLIQSFKAGTLDDVAEDMFVAKLIQSGTDSLKQAAIKTYAKTKPELVSFVDQVIGDMAGKIKNLNDTQYADNIAEVSKFIDEANMTQEMKDFLKNQYKTEANKIRLSSRINYADDVASTIAGKTFDDLYTLYELGLKNTGKKAFTKEELIKNAKSAESLFKDDPLKLIEYLVTKSENPAQMGKKIEKVFGVTEAIVDGTGNIIEKSAGRAVDGIKKKGILWTVMALMAVGVGYAFFNPDKMGIWFAKAKSGGGTKKAFVIRFGDTYEDLPDELQKVLDANYSTTDFDKVNNPIYIDSLSYTPSSDELTPSFATVTFSDGTFDKYANSLENEDVWSLTKDSTHKKSSSSIEQGKVTSDADLLKEFKTWWEGQGYEDYTNPVVSNGTITVKVGNDSYSYIKSGNGFVQPEE
jgi:hypothetical protein